MPDLANSDSVNVPPFDTADLRRNLAAFLDSDYSDPTINRSRKVGNFKWGVYAFFDYDGEPIYVGQTYESLRQRIGRHLTNQRTDAVAMSVLDPFEVLEIEVWPLPEFQSHSNPQAKAHLDALECLVYRNCLQNSKFGAVLNEKDPPVPVLAVTLPPSMRGRIVSEGVYQIRVHPDFRIARRALIISRLAQVISERKVQGGLRRVLLTQAKRLQWLAQRRFDALGGDALVESENDAE
jgi:hypothetical protein